jgi:hypothetical protein
VQKTQGKKLPDKTVRDEVKQFALRHGLSFEEVSDKRIVLSQPISEELRIEGAPPTSRRIEMFRSLTRTMTMADVVRKCGVPDEDQGSGLYVFVYHLEDGSDVVIGTPDLKQLLYVSHRKKSGSSDLLPPK